MNKQVAFVVVVYKQDISPLLNQLSGYEVFVVDNTIKNVGYGAAANIGLKKLFFENFEWVVILNQDVNIINSNGFVKNLEKREPGIAGPFAGSLDKKRWTTIFPSEQIDYISGSCIAIHRGVFEKIGGFYEPYFMYYEDTDYCVRAKKAGFPIIKTSDNFMQHTDSKSDHEWYLFRNHLLFVGRLAPLTVKLYELFRLPKTIYEYWS